MAGLIAGPAIAMLVYLAPIPFPAAGERLLAAILAWVLCYWVTEPIPLPVTALFGATLCVLAGLAPAKIVFAPYAHPIVFLFIGSFLLAEALTVHGVDRRFAAWVLSLSWVGRHPFHMLLAVGGITAVISMWISNAATTALMLPIALGIVHSLPSSHSQKRDGYGSGLMLLLSYAATAGGLATPIGTPPNLIGLGMIAEQTGVTIPFATWMMIGCPLALVALLVACRLIWERHPMDSSVVGEFLQGFREKQQPQGPWTRGQINTVVAFGTAVGLWLLPGFLAVVWGPASPLARWTAQHLPNEVAAILAASLLFVLPTGRTRGESTLSWRQAASINWGVILLFGGGLALGELMVRTGLSQSLGSGFVSLFGGQTLWSLTAVSILLAILVSELVSNTATATMVIPLVIAIAQSADVSPIPPALGACLASSFGFALPTSTAPNAIVYGTGLIPLRQMIGSGLLFDLLGAVFIWLTLRVMCPLLQLL